MDSNKKGMPSKKMDLFFTKHLNNSFISSKSEETGRSDQDENVAPRARDDK